MENKEMASGGGVGPSSFLGASVGRNVWGRESGEISGGFSDLEVYKNSFKGMITVFKQILPLLPKEEKYDLTDQLRRSSKAIPRLIAEGHSKRHQNKGFQKYIDDAHAESNETIVSLIQARELYLSNDKRETCNNLIDLYDKISRQLYNLAYSWEKFHRRKPHDS